MIYIRNITTAALLALITTASVASAKTPLAKENHINYSLMAAKVADRIRKTCPSISARMFVALGKANALKAYALDKGYTEPEVRAFLKNPMQKARIEALAANYLKQHGAVTGDVESYCTVGRAEIAKKSLIGQMLRAK